MSSSTSGVRLDQARHVSIGWVVFLMVVALVVGAAASALLLRQPATTGTLTNPSPPLAEAAEEAVDIGPVSSALSPSNALAAPASAAVSPSETMDGFYGKMYGQRQFAWESGDAAAAALNDRYPSYTDRYWEMAGDYRFGSRVPSDLSGAALAATVEASDGTFADKYWAAAEAWKITRDALQGQLINGGGSHSGKYQPR